MLFRSVALVLATSNLAIGVVGGVFVASVLFVRRVAHFVTVDRHVILPDDGAAPSAVRYTVTGELLFASSNDLTTQFEYAKDPQRVIIDMSQAHIWDASTVAALDAIMTKYRNYGREVELVGMNRHTASLHRRLTEQ